MLILPLLIVHAAVIFYPMKRTGWMIYYSRQNVERKKEAEELAVKLIEETNVLTPGFLGRECVL